MATLTHSLSSPSVFTTKGRFQIQDIGEDRGYDGDSELPRVRMLSVPDLEIVNGGMLSSPECKGGEAFVQSELHPANAKWSIPGSDFQMNNGKFGFVPSRMREDEDMHWASETCPAKVSFVLHPAPDSVAKPVSRVKPVLKRMSTSPAKLGRFEVRDVDEDHENDSLRSGEEIDFHPRFDNMFRSSSDETDTNAARIPYSHGSADQNFHRQGVSNQSDISIEQLKVDEIFDVLRTRMNSCDSEAVSLKKENKQLQAENDKLRRLCMSLASSCGIDISGLLSDIPQATQQNRL